MIKDIAERRSIRKFQDQDIKKEMIEEILQAGILAPSSKNRQPWKFVVTAKSGKKDMLEAMKRGLEREKKDPLLKESGKHLAGAEYTLKIMTEAPVVIFAVNPLGISLENSLTAEERIYEICNAQSIGAALENMALTAEHLGLGSLWICDTYFAYRELMEWLGMEGELFAAMAIGYKNETPSPRPRKKLEDVTEWRTEG